MKKCLTLIAAAFILGLGTTGFAAQINDFTALMDALRKGETVKVVMKYVKCQLISEGVEQEKSPDATGGMTIEAWEYFETGVVHNKQAFVTFSVSSLIQNPKSKGYVYDYVKVRINADNTVKILARYINPKNYKTVMDETFTGIINDGKNEGGVFLY
ncbi:MAG: VirK family protein [Bacteroidetes bacterium]|nr:VirK family protein [Bacteroidota bacterium]